MKLLLYAIAMLLFGRAAVGQELPGPPPVPAVEPEMILTFGLGGSQFSDPRYGVTGSVGKRVANGTYALVSLDFGLTLLDPVTGQRKLISTVRPGVQKILARTGPFTVTVAGDFGGSVTPSALVGHASGGGSLIYALPKNPNLFVYGNVRVIKSPQADPALSNPAIIQTAFSVGVGFKLK